MAVPTTINLYGTVQDSIVDGPGLRFTVFVQGCSHHCPGCHNEKSQPTEGGVETPIDDVLAQIEANKGNRNVTLSGGEPFEQPAACAQIAARLKAKGYGVWAYSGYLYEDLLAQAALAQDEHATPEQRERAAAIQQLLENVDVLVDGPFIMAKKSLGLLYRGSSNQRLIDLRATERKGQIVLWEKHDDFPTKPPSW